MKVYYNGFTGELMNLDRLPNSEVFSTVELPERQNHKCVYNLFIFDSEKMVAHCFSGVNLEDVKFFGGEVSFG